MLPGPCIAWLSRVISQINVISLRSFSTIALLAVCTACDNGALVGNLEKRFPIEVESCLCRYLAFEADSYSHVSYEDMLNHCNTLTRQGHPSLPDDIISEPGLDALRCPDDVEDWREVLEEERAQEASNRQNYKEIMQLNTKEK